MNVPFQQISDQYQVRRLAEEDLPELLELCRGNPAYYEHMHTRPTIENLAEDRTKLPRGKTAEDKYFLGCYQGGRLAAALDLITAYPNPETAFIGWFILRKDLQGRGTGTALITELLSFLKGHGFRYVRLGYVKGNPESRAFWIKNHFLPTGAETDGGGYTITVMQRTL